MLSAGATSGTSQGIAIGSRYVQARARMRLRSALDWTALARAEQLEGTEYYTGRKVTLESDINYRIGKWQANARYRYRDARQQFAPFKDIGFGHAEAGLWLPFLTTYAWCSFLHWQSGCIR